MTGGQGRSRERVYGVVLLAVGTAVPDLRLSGQHLVRRELLAAIASHPFAEIWSIGSHDVHPVLYYWMLHVVYLVFGKSIVAFRIFTLLGSVAMVLAGITCIARDFGERTGLLFTFLSLFVPIVGFMCLQVRMYSWASFAVALTAVYAYRISTVAMFHADSGDGEARTQGEVPLRWWAVLFGASLASAYLHYYAAIAAFLINVFPLVDLVRGKAARRGRSCPFSAVPQSPLPAIFPGWWHWSGPGDPRIQRLLDRGVIPRDPLRGA